MAFADELERLEKAFDEVKKQLFSRLFDIARQQLIPDAPSASHLSPPPTQQAVLVLENGTNHQKYSNGNGNGRLLPEATSGIVVDTEAISTS